MTSSDFWLDLLSNTIATTVGVVAGVPVAMWLERRRKRGEDAAAEAERLEKHRTALEGRRAEQRAVVLALIMAVATNMLALEQIANEASASQLALGLAIDVRTWDALQPRVVDRIDDAELIGRMAVFFTNLQAFEASVVLYRNFTAGIPIRELAKRQIVSTAPTLRHDAEGIRRDLMRLISDDIESIQ